MSSVKSSKGTCVFIGPAQPVDANEATFEGLSYVEVTGLGAVPDLGVAEEINTFSPLKGVDIPFKGNLSIKDVEISMARIHDDPGQVALRAAGETNFYYAVKYVLNDAPAANMTKTTLYTRALIGKTSIKTGGGNDPILDTCMIKGAQEYVKVDPAVIV